MERVCVVVASGQNVFFDELLTALESELRVQGVETERAIDHFPATRDGTAYLFVPHEYMPLTMPDAHPNPDQLRRSVALCTEQPGTHWFDEAAALAEGAGAVIDINREGVRALRRRGIDAKLLALGWVPGWDHWGGDETRERPFDVTFMAAHTQRRAAALARCGSVLSRRRAYLNVTDDAVPNTLATGSFLAGTAKWECLASSRLLLNVHRSSLGYLEWQRVVGAIANGCVVLTEHSLGTSPLVAGEHFVSASLDNLPHVLDALLEDRDRVIGIRRAAYRLLRDELPLSASMRVLTDALERAAVTPISGLHGRHYLRPRPRPASAPVPEYERLTRERTDADVMRMALKHVLITQSDLRRRLDAPEARPDTVRRIGDQSRRPRVSVLLTVFNYAHTVAEAVASVAASEFQDIELVVVDDASTDASLDVVRRSVATADAGMATTLLAHGQNRGLPEARNAGIRHCRGEYVFILDADNAVYPHCLGRLAEALDANPDAAFAYGLLEVFDATGSRDLLSWRDWDRDRLRYGNYVDAMAMIRRPVLESVDGYTTDPRLFGWEDFALWCTLAEHGWSGVRVPEIVARYRKGLLSMLSLTDIDGWAAWAALVESHSFLTAGDS